MFVFWLIRYTFYFSEKYYGSLSSEINILQIELKWRDAVIKDSFSKLKNEMDAVLNELVFDEKFITWVINQNEQIWDQ